MARRRYQRGSVYLSGTRELVWVGRWREDTIGADGKVRRICRKQVLGSKRELQTKKLALRELASRLAPINSTSYRALHSATFAEFAELWNRGVLTQHKPSTQAAAKSQLRNWLIPYFGDFAMRDITPQALQMFVQKCPLSPKSCLNLTLILRMMWKTARAWDYVAHDPFDGLVLPKLNRQTRFFFTVAEIQDILAKATEPQKTFYWLASETGMRAGELCGLRVEDVDLGNAIVSVQQSVWRGKTQSPKTNNAVRKFAISPQLTAHLRSYLSTWRPNQMNLVFATRAGKPWSPCNLMRSHLHPLLDSLGIRRCGLHAFRHANGSLMDRLNAPMKIRQERLGHAAGSEITMALYTHSVGEDHRRVADQIGELLCPLVSKFAETETTPVEETMTVQ
jgi:integrase